MPVLKPEEAAQIGDEQAQLQAEFEAHQLQKEFTQHAQERSGMIRRQPYTSTGTGAAIGMVAGGVAGALAAKSGVPLAAPALVVGGTALGEAAEQGLYALTSRDPGSAITPKESLTNLGEQAGAAVAGEGVGAAALRFMKPLRYVQARPLTPEQMARKEALDVAGVRYLPNEITDSGFQKFLTDLGEYGIFSPAGFTELRESQATMQKTALQAVTDTLGAKVHPSDLGQAAVALVKDARLEAKVAANTLYNGVEDVLKFETKTRQVPTGNQIPHESGMVDPSGNPILRPEMATESYTEGGLLADISKTTELYAPKLQKLQELSATNPQVATLLKTDPFYSTAATYAVGNEPIQWNTAHELLKSARRELRVLENSPSIQTNDAKRIDSGTLKSIVTVLEKDLENALIQSPNPAHRPALDMWQAGQALVKERSEVLRNDAVVRLVKTVEAKGGEPAIRQFISALSPDEMQQVITATAPRAGFIGPSYVQDTLKRAFVTDALEKSGGMQGDHALVNPAKFRDAVFGQTSLTSRKADILIPVPQRQQLGHLINAIEEQQKQMKPGAMGSMFMAMKTSGAVFQVGAAAGLLLVGQSAPFSATLGSLTIIAGPRMLGEWLLKPETTKLLTQGARYTFSQSDGPKVRVLKELMSTDRNFARVVQTTVSQALVGAQPGGAPARTAESTQLQSVNSLPTAFPLEK